MEIRMIISSKDVLCTDKISIPPKRQRMRKKTKKCNIKVDAVGFSKPTEALRNMFEKKN